MTGAHAIILQGKGSGGFAFPETNPDQSKEGTVDQVDVLPVEQSAQRRRHPLSTLIPDCVEAISALNLENPPLIVAAGGITTGEDIEVGRACGKALHALGPFCAAAGQDGNVLLQVSKRSSPFRVSRQNL